MDEKLEDEPKLKKESTGEYLLYQSVNALKNLNPLLKNTILKTWLKLKIQRKIKKLIWVKFKSFSKKYDVRDLA